MRLARPVPGLLGRLLVILLALIGVEFVASTWVYERSSRALIRADEAHRLAEHLAISRRLVAGRAPAGRAAMAAQLTSGRYALRWTAARLPPLPADPRLAAMRREVISWEPELDGSDLRLRLSAASGPPVVAGALTLPDGTAMRFRASLPEGGAPPAHRILPALLPAALLLLLGGWLFGRTIRPVNTLARAVERVGRGGGVTLPEAGPPEMRRLIAAFNVMQARIRQLIADRTQALAAVGHDLRTPLARLQLRADLIADADLRAALAADVAEMEAMVVSLLAFLGGESDPEPPMRVDVAVLAATVADDATDRGGLASYHGPDHCEAVVRGGGLKRALGNLVENALHYGGSAELSLCVADGTLLLAVADRGPGIPDADLARALEPFTRLDSARGRDTRGLGLGLAIVARAAALEGGTLALANRPGGGLVAQLRLPHRTEAEAGNTSSPAGPTTARRGR